MTYFSVSWYWIHAYIIINGIVIHGQVTSVLHFMSQRSDYTMVKHIVRRMLQRSFPVRYGLTFSDQVVTRVQCHILSGKNDDLYLTELWPWCKLTWHLLMVFLHVALILCRKNRLNFLASQICTIEYNPSSWPTIQCNKESAFESSSPSGLSSSQFL